MTDAAAAGPTAGDVRHGPAWLRRLPLKFLTLVSATFLAIIVPGTWLMFGFVQKTDEASLTARIGNLAARAALAVDRHHAYGNPRLAGDLISPLASDRAFLCAELRSGDAVAVAVPRAQGCAAGRVGNVIELPVDTLGRWTLKVGFTDAELLEARRLEMLLGSATVALAFLAAMVAGSLGFRSLVWKPLQLLTSAIRHAAETGTRRAVAWKSGDELGLVVEAFNGLIEQEARRELALTSANERLQASESALSALNRGLEIRVRERTRQLEQEKLRAEIANDTKTRFLWSMSHELRTPLNAIIGFSEIMATGMFGPVNNPRYQGFVQDINQSGRHLLEIINDLLDIARIEVGEETLREEPVALDALLADCLRVVRSMADDRGLTLRTAPTPPGLALRLDRTKIKQVLLNLLSNAIKNTPDGGTIAVTVEAGPGNGAAFRIADTGRGIAPENIPRVLEPFARIDDNHHLTSKGTGLGLPLARMMTEMHGGSLTIESAVGRGTTVIVALPGDRVIRDPATLPGPARAVS